MRLPLSVYRSRIGVQWADPSVRPWCVVTPRYSRWFMDGRSAPLSRPRKGWDSKMYPPTLSRHESGRAPLGLSCLWRGGRWGVCNTPLPIRQEEVSRRRLSRPRKGWDSKMYPQTLSRHESERATLWLFHSRKGWDLKMYPLTLSRHESERATLGLSRPWRGGRGADIFATCLYSFLVTITPRLTFHF